MKDNKLRHLPSVDKVISDERLCQYKKTYPHSILVDIVRQHLEQDRLAIASDNSCPTIDEIVQTILARLSSLTNASLRPVINASGVLLHTNIGRAPLSRESLEAMNAVAASYCNLEYDLDDGTRDSRYIHIEPILCQLTGAEGAVVVNNNTAAVLLALTALAKRREVIVSRGQSIEIGGGFRIPDVIRQSGVKLVEVGTTNCTYADDYEKAINPRTAALLRVHTSNFRITGFTSNVSLDELVTLGNQYNLQILDDLGSGCFLDTSKFNLAPEPMVPQSVAHGAGLVFFSGDKLVGGPQAGIIVGKNQFINKLKNHPLARAMRIDKITLAGLVTTLIHYLRGEAVNKIPIWRMISTPLSEIEQRAGIWSCALGHMARVIEGETVIGGGSLPGSTLPTRLVTIKEKSRNKHTAEVLSRKLRCQKIPVIGRISNNILLLDPRSVLPEDDETVLQALRELVSSSESTE